MTSIDHNELSPERKTQIDQDTHDRIPDGTSFTLVVGCEPYVIIGHDGTADEIPSSICNHRTPQISSWIITNNCWL